MSASARARVAVRARAKINLDLRILGRRADGYHELRTVFQTLTWHDTVTVSRVPGPLASAGDPSKMPLDHSNLAWRAADPELLRRVFAETRAASSPERPALSGYLGVWMHELFKAIGRAFGMPTTMLIDRHGCELGTIADPAEWASDDAVTLIKAALGQQ